MQYELKIIWMLHQESTLFHMLLVKTKNVKIRNRIEPNYQTTKLLQLREHSSSAHLNSWTMLLEQRGLQCLTHGIVIV